MLRISGVGPPDPHTIRLLALAGLAVCAFVVPLAVASVGSVGDPDRSAVRRSAQDTARGSSYDPSYDDRSRSAYGDQKSSSAAPGSTRVLGLGLATAARCGPELSSPDGVEAQTCVLTQGEDTWARTYYRNSTGRPLDAVLSLMGPGRHAVRMHCRAGSDDEPATCETPRERTRGDLDGYTAVTEFAARGGEGPLLLRSASNTDFGVNSKAFKRS
ncbi:hypothetical protein [Streptomyces brasiliensis]|uniref:Uncharacterized protein n=1 Tax=Streptomyces brasiliensis TaxID=1954 RepID=A0A917NQ77_9ACTN|nr:hypothetical protein [Streptomyces brasiliensis]GGJ14526.1 hypothetical protein GCM10010121_026450 [Streptomyces brasiliensis]